MITQTKTNLREYIDTEHGKVGRYYFEGQCLSTDPKPTTMDVANGSILLEMDTSKVYMYDQTNAEWREW